MPSIKQLKYAIKIVELGSINEASKQLFITQPTLSNSIKELEKELNIQIFRRSIKGVSLTDDGTEFLAYARQIVDQVDLMEMKYKNKTERRQHFSVSGQHYAFAVHAFVELVRHYDENEYEFTLRETETHNILEDVSTFRSEIGVIFLNDFNQQVLEKVFKEKSLEFIPLFEASPHVFIGKNNPLASYQQLTLEDLEDYPYLSYEQGEVNSFYFSEEILSTQFHKKSLKVSDRASMFNLMIGLNGYTVSSGVISRELNDEKIIAIPLKVDSTMTIGWLKNQNSQLSPLAIEYLGYLKSHIEEYGFDVSPHSYFSIR